MKKLIIANKGAATKGKSSTIKEVFNLLDDRYPNKATITYPVSSADVLAIIEARGVRIGIESQGDPGSRMFDSLDYFQKQGCKIIIAACRTYGETTDAIAGMKAYGYDVIWTSNDKNEDEGNIRVNDHLNFRFAEHIVQLVEDRIDNKY